MVVQTDLNDCVHDVAAADLDVLARAAFGQGSDICKVESRRREECES